MSGGHVAVPPKSGLASIITYADKEWLDAARLAEEHHQLVELLRRGKQLEAKRALVTHIDQYEKRLLELLRDVGGGRADR